ncbi:MAG: site-specific DNA-methyltransferase [Chitinophagales bacterium]
MNHLYFGDSLDILKELHAQHPEGFIDLIYIDPPFNSKRNYNVLFETVDIHDAKAQKEAFADTWSNVSYFDTISELKASELHLTNLLEGLQAAGISKSAISYLSTMAIRIFYIHKVLKSTGSFYLHCDTTMSHYLKIICDIIFGVKNFRNDIIWKRSDAKGDISQGAKHLGRNTDNILFYTKSDDAYITQLYTPMTEDYIDRFYRHIEEGTGRRYKLDNMLGPGGAAKGNPYYEVMGIKRYWRYSKEKMAELIKAGRVIQTNPGTVPMYKRYLDESKGVPLGNLWIDIDLVRGHSKEKLGYPTQKPVALLERIIQISSKPGDLVADFFCGCGTTIAAAQKLNRKWIGVDISHLAVGLIRKRLIDNYGEEINKTFDIKGLPKDVASAHMLAEQPQGRMRFQDWVIETLIGGVTNEKKVGDGGYDGYTTLEVEKGKKEIVYIEVKSGNINVSTLRSFAKTVQQQKGSAGILVCFKEQITKGMLNEAKGEGYFREDLFGNRFDKIQIISVEDLLDGKMPELPRSTETGPFKKAEKAEKKGKSKGLFD